jgi:putative endopeptidase
MNRKELAALTPSFSWDTFFADVGRPDLSSINVGTPSYFQALDAELRTAPLDTLREYLRVRLLSTYSPYLSRPFQDEAFRMTAAITGVSEMLPRWLRVLHAADDVLGFAVGKKYVEEAFPPSAKESAIALLHGIRAALEQDLATVSWMGPSTRAEAALKLSQMGERIGYPDVWRDYGPLVVDRGPYVLNVLRGKAFEERRELDKIDHPVDRTEWEMTPQTVNAYYDPSTNDINFPAAILQPPFFDPAAPLAVNEGAIGFVMGHEMTHGFDDEGAQFDGKGNLRNWWTPDDLARFKAQTSCIADQFSSYEVEGVRLDGRLVVGEATADLGGLTLAYRAFHAAMSGEPAADVLGYSPDQQFFLAAAHVWAQNVRPEEARLRAKTDPHPPAQFRVNGTVANMPEFQKAFGVPEGSPMVNVPRCSIW